MEGLSWVADPGPSLYEIALTRIGFHSNTIHARECPHVSSSRFGDDIILMSKDMLFLQKAGVHLLGIVEMVEQHNFLQREAYILSFFNGMPLTDFFVFWRENG
jgi:hypothetical protein